MDFPYHLISGKILGNILRTTLRPLVIFGVFLIKGGAGGGGPSDPTGEVNISLELCILDTGDSGYNSVWIRFT
jgi:hypothetical protein